MGWPHPIIVPGHDNFTKRSGIRFSTTPETSHPNFLPSRILSDGSFRVRYCLATPTRALNKPCATPCVNRNEPISRLPRLFSFIFAAMNTGTIFAISAINTVTCGVPKFTRNIYSFGSACLAPTTNSAAIIWFKRHANRIAQPLIGVNYLHGSTSFTSNQIFL